MKVTLEIADDDIRAALATFEETCPGGWALGFNAPLLQGHFTLATHDLDAIYAIERELSHGSDGAYLLDIERGLQMMAYESVVRLVNIVDWAHIPECCSRFVQYAAFGKLVYP